MSEIPELSPAPPVLVVLSGPSGVGKDAALAQLKRLDRPWHFAVTATTRAKRPGEREGADYLYLSTEKFDRMRERDEFLECAEVYGNWYGVPRSQIRAGLQAGKDVILKIDVQGAATVRQLAPEALFIFLLPGTSEELEQRLLERMTESAPDLELRLKTAAQEMSQVQNFNYRVINHKDRLDRAVADIDAIITAEKCRIDPRMVDLL